MVNCPGCDRRFDLKRNYMDFMYHDCDRRAGMDTLELLVAYIEREDARADHVHVRGDAGGTNGRWRDVCIRANAYCDALSAAGGGYYWNTGERSF